MAVEIERLRVVIEGDDSGAKQIDESVDKARKGVKRFAQDADEALKHLRASAAGALSDLNRTIYENLTRPAIDAGKAWIEAASDVGEQLSKVRTLLGKSGDDVDQWSKRTATAIGVSRREALAFTGTFANLFRAMNFDQASSATMSKGLVQLAADLASFNNTSVTEALDALRSGMVGETEPLRRFGVNMSEVTLKAEAMKLGLIKSTKEGLSPAQKAAAAYSLVMQQTSIAQGDFARTSGGLANQQRMLAAEFEDLRAKLGEQLLPIALQAVKIAREWVYAWSNLPDSVRDVITIVAGLAAAIPAVVLAFRQMSVIGALVKETLAGLGPVFAGIAAAVGVSVGELLLIIAAVAAAAAALYFAWTSNLGGVRDATEKAMATIRPVLENFARWLSQTLPTALAAASIAISTALTGLVQLYSQSLSALWGAIKSIWEVIKGFVTGLVAQFQSLWRFLLDYTPLGEMVRLWETAFGALQTIVMKAVRVSAGVLSSFFEMLSQATGANEFVDHARAAMTGFEGAFSAALYFERQKVESQLGGIKKMFSGFHLPSLPKIPGLSVPDFKGMNLAGLPGNDKDKADKEAKRHAEELKKRLADITEEMMRLTLNRYDFERWQAQQAFDKDIKLGVDKAKAQHLLSATLRQIMIEEGRAHQQIIDEMTKQEADAYEKRTKLAARFREHLESAIKKSNEAVKRFNEAQVREFEREQKAAAEEVARGLEAQAAVSMRIVEGLKDQASALDAVGKRTDYYSAALAKLNLQNEALTDEQRTAVHLYADAWRELDRIHERQKLIQQTSQELHSIFSNAFAAGLRNAKNFFREIERGIKETIIRQVADMAASVAVKGLMDLFGMKQNGLSESARSARNDLLVGSAALAAAAAALKSAAKDARKAAGTQAGAAAGSMFGPVGSIVGAVFGGFFAEGGTLQPGHWGIVGERGPEIVQAGSAPLHVTPNVGRNATVNMHFYGDLKADGPDRVARELRRSLAIGM